MFPLGRCGFGCAALFCCFLPCFSIYCFYKPAERGSTVIDTKRFLQARKEALGRVGGAGGIGTLSEKALHAALKSYYEPDFESREVKVGSFVADIVGENGIIEIQTRGFDRLGRKLDAFLEAARQSAGCAGWTPKRARSSKSENHRKRAQYMMFSRSCIRSKISLCTRISGCASRFWR